jgi:uncharacterized membrane protein YccC
MADQVQQLTDAVSQIQQTLAGVLQSVTDVANRVSDEQATLQATIDELKAHPAAPDLSNQLAALQAVANSLTGAKTQLDAIDPAQAPATPATQQPTAEVTPDTTSPSAVAATTDAPQAETVPAGSN